MTWKQFNNLLEHAGVMLDEIEMERLKEESKARGAARSEAR